MRTHRSTITFITLVFVALMTLGLAVFPQASIYADPGGKGRDKGTVVQQPTEGEQVAPKGKKKVKVVEESTDQGAEGTTTTTSATTEGAATTTTTTADDSLTGRTFSKTLDGSAFHTVGNAPPTGNEVFISMGGVKGSSYKPALEALQEGYARSGFRVHYIVEAMSFAPFEAKMAEVAAEYIQRKDMQLDHVVFHHAGHGWDGKIIYETPAGARGETSHAKIFQTLGDQFPKKEASFANTKFGVVLDACGQGTAADRQVAGRSGFVATASPDLPTRYTILGRTGVFRSDNTCLVATHQYSLAFGQNLNSTVPDKIPAFKTAHDAGVKFLNDTWNGKKDGKFETY